MEYYYYYTMKYLPVRYMANNEEKANRCEVWNFKDGNCSRALMNRLSEFIEKIVADGRKSDYVICFIPASTSYKTENRYSVVASKLTERTGVRATLSAIRRTRDTEAGHITGNRINPTGDFIFNSCEFSGKKVILIDDVITSGRTFSRTVDKMMSRGATSVIGLFVAKTVNPDWNESAA